MRKIYALDGERIAERFKAPIDVRVELWKHDAEMAARVAPRAGVPARVPAELAEFDRQRATPEARGQLALRQEPRAEREHSIRRQTLRVL